jgi:hypothetical protein
MSVGCSLLPVTLDFCIDVWLVGWREMADGSMSHFMFSPSSTKLSHQVTLSVIFYRFL